MKNQFKIVYVGDDSWCNCVHDSFTPLFFIWIVWGQCLLLVSVLCKSMWFTPHSTACVWCHDSIVVSIVTRYQLDDQVFKFHQGQKTFLFFKMSRLAAGPPRLIFNGYSTPSLWVKLTIHLQLHFHYVPSFCV